MSRQERPNSAQPKVHGTYTKYFQPEFAARQNKCKLGVIHPIPIVERREKPVKEDKNQHFNIVVNSVQMKHAYQEKKLEKKPVSEQLAKPFMYVEKVMPKRKTEETAMKHNDVWIPNPAVDTTRKPKHLSSQTVPQAGAPAGHHVSLYDIEEHKRTVAKEFFERLHQSDPELTFKGHFVVWARTKRLKLDKDQNIDEDTLTRFVREFTSEAVSSNLTHDFFDCYYNQAKTNERTVATSKNQLAVDSSAVPVLSKAQQKISMKALCYNYETFIKSKSEVNRVLSDRAAQERYTNMKIYIDHWQSNYPSIKSTMKHMREYENRLRHRFEHIRDSYQNPFVGEIAELKKELQQPMIKYDKPRKEALEKKIEEYLQQHERTHQRVHDQYRFFSEAFEDNIVHNHNLFFKKKALMKLLAPLAAESNRITKEKIEAQVGFQQTKYQQYLEVLSRYTIEFGADKKMLKEESFTLAELAHFLSKSCQSKEEVLCMRKLVRRIKEQHCLKQRLEVEDMEQFPGDEQISVALLNQCFEIECTRVLFKNQVWGQLLQSIVIPAAAYQSKYHAETINMNITLEAVRRLFDEIDHEMALELNRSRQICRLVEDINYDEFQTYAEIIMKIDLSSTPEYEGSAKNETRPKEAPAASILRKFAGEAADIVEEEAAEDRKVKFADMIYTNLDKLREVTKKEEEEKARLEQDKTKQEVDSAMKLLNSSNMFESILVQREEEIKKAAKDLSKVVISRAHNGFNRSIVEQEQPPQPAEEVKEPTHSSSANELQMMKTLTKSFYVSEPLNVNALDARFHEQSMSKIQEEKKRSTLKNSQFPTPSKVSVAESSLQAGVIGQSVLLSNLPKIEELPEDPLRISRYLLKTLDNIDQENSKHIEPKHPDKTIREGVNHNYFKEKVDFEKKPAVFDCEGASKYSLMLPVNYYSNTILQEQDKDKWYLRPHHVETLTENPLSKKDNVVSTEYKSALDRIEPKKRPDELVIEENVRRKDVIIHELEERLTQLRENLQYAKRDTSYKGGARVPVSVVDNYFNRLTKDKQDKELEVGAYESILYDLRKSERDMLVGYRGDELARKGYPQDKWWERKDPTFVEEYIRHRDIETDSRRPPEQQRHIPHIERLSNEELY